MTSKVWRSLVGSLRVAVGYVRTVDSDRDKAFFDGDVATDSASAIVRGRRWFARGRSPCTCRWNPRFLDPSAGPQG